MKAGGKATFQVPPRFSLAQLPTPLEVFPLSPDPDSGIEIFIKRDDLTGSILSGNKIRKLEFLFYDLVRKKADVVITCGGVQSNHCRAVAALCAVAGIECRLVLKGRRPAVPDGNLFLAALSGAQAKFITVREYEKNVDSIMKEMARRYRRKGRNPYIIPEGGSDPLGVWGYIKASEEIKKQTDEARIKVDVIACAVGSGGTYAGLYLGCKLAGWDIRVVGFAVSRNARYFQKRIFDLCLAVENDLGRKLGIEPEEFDIDDRFIGPGYGRIGPVETDFIRTVAANSGIILDPAYTSKALLGLFRRIDEGSFAPASNIVFIHTGGQWGLIPHRAAFAAGNRRRRAE